MVDWLNISQASGRGDTNITVTASANTGSTRNTELTLSGHTKTDTVSVLQHAVPSDAEFAFDVTSAGTISWGIATYQFPSTTYVPSISYSKNGGTWSSPSSSDTISVVAGDELKFKGDNQNIIRLYFTSNGAMFSAKGNIMSLISSTGYQSADTASEFEFYRKFTGCTGLTDASGIKMPSGSIGRYCCWCMFMDCTNLMAAPELPATDLWYGAYLAMFYQCPSLVLPPSVLPATVVPGACYTNMFGSCTSLATAPEICATTFWDSYYSNVSEGSCNGMFTNCRSLETPPSVLKPKVLGKSSYMGMFNGCSAMKESPVIEAETLADMSLDGMFQGCSLLSSITCLATSNVTTSSTLNWVSGVSRTGTFVKSSSMNSWSTGKDGIPSGWTVTNYVQQRSRNILSTKKPLMPVAIMGTQYLDNNKTNWIIG